MRKFTAFLLIAALFSTCLVLPAGASTFSFDVLPGMEKFVFGRINENIPLKSRLESLEKELLGKEKQGSLLERYRDLQNLMFCSEGKPGLIMTTNILEWSLTGEVTDKPLGERLALMEAVVLGQKNAGAILTRINALMDLTFPKGELEVAKVPLPPGVVVKIKLLDGINSSTSREGDVIPYQVVEDVIVNGKLVIPAGVKGSLTLSAVEDSSFLGQDARVEMQFNSVTTLDGNQVQLILAERAREMNDTLKYVAGASILGSILLGPVGLLAGFFVKGKNVNIPSGTEFYLETPPGDMDLLGLVVSNSEATK